MNQFILALCGLPASGKSSLADAIRSTVYSKGLEVEVVRTDEWRDDAYYSDFVPEKEGCIQLLQSWKCLDNSIVGFW